jgi:predicted NUDIX family NTP pyrophosphohydrolase
MVLSWLGEADLDLAMFNPGAFEMEWPPKSGKRVSFPEVDRVDYFDPETALAKVLPSQVPLIREALLILDGGA